MKMLHFTKEDPKYDHANNHASRILHRSSCLAFLSVLNSFMTSVHDFKFEVTHVESTQVCLNKEDTNTSY